MRILAFLFTLTFAATSTSYSATEPIGIQVPDGFVVTRYATDELAHDIYSMTLDARGNVVVAGRGYVKTLFDRDGDGVADSFREFSSIPRSGAHGMVFDGHDLICTGDNSVMRIRDADGDGVGDQPAEIWTQLRSPEHGANGLIQGPDGWFYLICGNDAGTNASHAQTPTSPVRDPKSGALVRFSPDGKTSEVVADGFRNPYDLSINRYGHIFTVDADGERDHHLPWYAPTRLFDIAAGEHHGWVNNGWKLSWSRPVSFFDNVDRVAELGRGSPTGLVVYRHTAYPLKYHHGVFSCCWTMGRVYFIPLHIVGSTYGGTPEVFLQTTGDVGFAPVDLAVAPSGDLFVAIGGRGTQGGVFRIHYRMAEKPSDQPGRLASVLAADQPLSAWSRAIWVPQALTLGAEQFRSAALNSNLPLEQRIRAVEILVELFDGLSSDLVAELTLPASPPEVMARVAWAIGRKPVSPTGARTLVSLSKSSDPRVVRAALGQLANGPTLTPHSVTPLVSRGLLTQDRRIRNTWIRWLAKSSPAKLPAQCGNVAARVQYRRTHEIPLAPSVLLKEAGSSENRLLQLELLRLLQLRLGDINVTESSPRGMVGYSPSREAPLTPTEHAVCEQFLLERFPTNDAEVDLEIARLAAMLQAGSPQWPELLTAMCSDGTQVEADIHYLMALAHVRGTRTEKVTSNTASTLLSLQPKMVKSEKFPSRNWPVRIAETYRRLCELDPALADHLIKHPSFGSPDHSLYVLNAPQSCKVRAAQQLAAKLAETDDDEWDTALVQVVALLPDDQAFPMLRERWSDYRLRDAIVDVLARAPQAADRRRFVEALPSPNPTTVKRAAVALISLGDPPTPDDLALTIASLQRYCSAERYAETRKELIGLLQHWTGRKFVIQDERLRDDQVVDAYQPWFDWFSESHPQPAAKLFGLAGQVEWQQRLNGIEWSAGDGSRGKTVYERRQCAACHAGNRRLGPDLTPVARRFSRDDLFAAIIDPNQNVSPLYQTKRFATRAGRVYSGMVVYESPNGTLLQLGPDEVVRIADDEIVEVTDSPVSLMPNGLLRDATDQELADLYAYLQQMARL